MLKAAKFMIVSNSSFAGVPGMMFVGVTFKVLTIGSTKMTVFCNVALCSVEEIGQISEVLSASIIRT